MSHIWTHPNVDPSINLSNDGVTSDPSARLLGDVDVRTEWNGSNEEEVIEVVKYPWETRGDTGELFMNLTIVQICVGVGLFALPYAFCLSGLYWGIAGVAVVAYANAVNSHWLQDCREAMIRFKLHGPPGSLATGTFGYVSRAAIGPRGPIIVDISVLITLLGCAILYFITLIHMLPQVFVSPEEMDAAANPSPLHPSHASFLTSILLSPTAVVVFLCLILTPTAFVKQLTALTFVSVAGVGAYVVALVAVVFASTSPSYSSAPAATSTESIMQIISDSPLWKGPTAPALDSMVEYLGMVACSFGVPVLTYDLEETMRHPSQLTRPLYTGMLIIGVMYCLIGGYLAIVLADPTKGTSICLIPSTLLGNPCLLITIHLSTYTLLIDILMIIQITFWNTHLSLSLSLFSPHITSLFLIENRPNSRCVTFCFTEFATRDIPSPYHRICIDDNNGVLFTSNNAYPSYQFT